jgi:hypothetical protein
MYVGEIETRVLGIGSCPSECTQEAWSYKFPPPEIMTDRTSTAWRSLSRYLNTPKHKVVQWEHQLALQFVIGSLYVSAMTYAQSPYTSSRLKTAFITSLTIYKMKS